MPQIYPVIHMLPGADRRAALAHVLAEAKLASEAGVDGVFIISHNGRDNEALIAATEVHDRMSAPDFLVGVNLLGCEPSFAFQSALLFGLDMVWLDSPGIKGDTLVGGGPRLVDTINLARNYSKVPAVFAGVAFKYQPAEELPSNAAALARQHGLIPTTSGPGTGTAPDVEKVMLMSASNLPLAVASGMTPDNIAAFAPFVSHVLVATGVSRDFHHIDFELLSVFVARAKAAAGAGL